MKIKGNGYKYVVSILIMVMICMAQGNVVFHNGILTSAFAAEPVAQTYGTSVPKATEAAATVKPTATPFVTSSPTSTPAPSLAPATPAPAAAAQENPLGVSDMRTLAELEKQAKLDEEAFDNVTIDVENYADFYFESVQTMQGIFSSIGLYVELPDYAQAKIATLRVSYTASDLILTDYSSITFYMNGTPFHSCRVFAQSENSPVVLYVDVPISLMQNGYNLLEIAAYVRLTNDEGCTDDYNGANWIKVADTTCLRIGYEVVADAEQIGYYPYPFISMMDKTGINCAVTVSDKAVNAELEAALTVMADMGELASSQNDIDFSKIGDTKRKYIIYFGLAENTSDELLGLLTQQVPRTGALIQRASTNQHEYLLVVAQEEAALLEAARFLSDESRVRQVQGKDTYISVGESKNIIDAGGISALALEGQYTLEDMLGHGMSFSGPFHQEITLFLPVVEDYVLSSESRFSLNIRYSENLDFDRSMMSVYWGSDIPLISRKLSREGAAGETVTFAVPADAVNQAGTSMVIAFDLEVKDLDCTPRQLNMPWAYVAANSTFYLPQGENNSLSLSNRPAPFQRESRLNDVLVVLAEKPTTEEYLLCGRTLSMLGGSDPYGTLKVLHANEFDAEDADYNLIVIGEAAGNGLIAKMNESLYFKYNSDMDDVVSNDKLVISKDYAKQIGSIQLIPSPYAENRAAMILSAPQSEGLQAIIARISAEKMRWAITKEAVILDGSGRAMAYQFTTTAANTAVDEKPTFTKVIMENKEPMLLLALGMGCMVLVLLGVILVLVRIRAHRKHDE